LWWAPAQVWITPRAAGTAAAPGLQVCAAWLPRCTAPQHCWPPGGQARRGGRAGGRAGAHVGVGQGGLGLALGGGRQLGRHAPELAPGRLADPGQLHLKGLLLIVHAVQAARAARRAGSAPVSTLQNACERGTEGAHQGKAGRAMCSYGSTAATQMHGNTTTFCVVAEGRARPRLLSAARAKRARAQAAVVRTSLRPR